ncbi:MAG TPA: TlpA disulfide reductase family protein [Pirellulaceae bacterium]|nr:TlpA disulfide reductase family protein [Pirellulaceae bacterium]HMP70136.1 TlpA disulfide reductase family protein [Pirellulaceae bacterium]
MACLMITSMDGLTMEFVPNGVTAKVGGYRPIRAEMNESEDIAKVLPDGIESPQFGLIKFGDRQWAFVLDQPEDSPTRLFVDSNGDGDLTNDPAATWEANERGGMTMYQGSAQIDLGGGRLGTINLYRFDPNDPQRAAMANTMLYYSDFGFEVSVELDDLQFSSFLAGLPDEHSSLSVDRNGDGKISHKRETILVNRPFNFTGKSYVIKVESGDLVLNKADEEIPLMPLPPDTSIGQPALEFSAETMSGDAIAFPKTFSGKVVMLDFWATWCGPCIAELPHMKEAYAKWHDAGFEILGVSFDGPDMTEKLMEFLEKNEMPWPQIYEGKGWETSLGELYDVSGIPFVLLVDGDSGEILATSRELRGPKLAEFIGEILEARSK